MRKVVMLAAVAAGLLALAPLRASVVAKIGSERVTSQELDAAAAEQAKAQGHALSREERSALLKSMVNQRLLVAEARDKRYDRDPTLKAQLAEAERRALADQVYEREVTAKAAVSLQEARRVYDQNPGLFDLAEVSQIVLLARPGQEAELEKRAQALKAKLAKAPRKFAEVAKAESEDTQSKGRGGDLGTLRRGMLLPELEAAVFGAKEGAVVGPVKTQFGWHILLVRSLKRLSWDEAGPGLQAEMQRLRAQQLQQALLERLAKEHKVVLSEDAP